MLYCNWSFVKSQENAGVAPLRENGKLVSDTTQKAEILNGPFSSVFTSETGPPPTLGNNPYPSMLNINVTVNRVKNLLTCLDPNKA